MSNRKRNKSKKAFYRKFTMIAKYMGYGNKTIDGLTFSNKTGDNIRFLGYIPGWGIKIRISSEKDYRIVKVDEI